MYYSTVWQQCCKLYITFTFPYIQFISEHQQDFVNYINNPNQNNPDPEGQGVNYITVTPREREEIDEVSFQIKNNNYRNHHALLSPFSYFGELLSIGLILY